MSSEILNLGPSGSAAQPAGPPKTVVSPKRRKRQGLKNRSITKEEIIFTTRQSREVSDEQTPREECKKVSNEEAKKTSRVMRVFNIGAFTVFAASVWPKENHSRRLKKQEGHLTASSRWQETASRWRTGDRWQ